jgi:predicted permease
MEILLKIATTIVALPPIVFTYLLLLSAERRGEIIDKNSDWLEKLLFNVILYAMFFACSFNLMIVLDSIWSLNLFNQQ